MIAREGGDRLRFLFNRDKAKRRRRRKALSKRGGPRGRERDRERVEINRGGPESHIHLGKFPNFAFNSKWKVMISSRFVRD